MLSAGIFAACFSAAYLGLWLIDRWARPRGWRLPSLSLSEASFHALPANPDAVILQRRILIEVGPSLEVADLHRALRESMRANWDRDKMYWVAGYDVWPKLSAWSSFPGSLLYLHKETYTLFGVPITMNANPEFHGKVVLCRP